MKILSGIDLPVNMIAGSLLFARDLYGSDAFASNEVKFFTLQGDSEPAFDRLPVVKESGIPSRAYIKQIENHLSLSLSGWKPDILHLHHLTYGMTEALVGLFPDTPSIVFVHGTDVYDSRKESSFALSAQRTLQHADIVVFPSLSLLRDALEAKLVIDPSVVRVIPWGLSETKNMIAKQDSSHSHPRAVIGARLTKNKDVITAVRAMALVDDITLDIFGSGPEAEAIFHEISYLGLSSRVRILPPVSRGIFRQKLAEYDVAIFPTREMEAFGLFGVECQMSGVPLVVSDIPVFKEIFGVSAIGFEVNNPISLAERLRFLFSIEGSLIRRIVPLLGRVNSSKYSSLRFGDFAALSQSLLTDTESSS